jgi:hypothetical protein
VYVTQEGATVQLVEEIFVEDQFATFLRSNRNVTIDMNTEMMRRGLMNWV